MKIDKRYQTANSYTLFPARECEQTWLFQNFVPTIDFASSYSLAYEKQE